mmetsp:Transcript_23437/g.35566  ORF Transcript_23437/g.35566 Transcript_23437/m.35566 type:complete len:280 (+) Transcript_23437:139-978(+)
MAVLAEANSSSIAALRDVILPTSSFFFRTQRLHRHLLFVCGRLEGSNLLLKLSNPVIRFVQLFLLFEYFVLQYLNFTSCYIVLSLQQRLGLNDLVVFDGLRLGGLLQFLYQTIGCRLFLFQGLVFGTPFGGFVSGLLQQFFCFRHLDPQSVHVVTGLFQLVLNQHRRLLQFVVGGRLFVLQPGNDRFLFLYGSLQQPSSLGCRRRHRCRLVLYRQPQFFQLFLHGREFVLQLLFGFVQSPLCFFVPTQRFRHGRYLLGQSFVLLLRFRQHHILLVQGNL